MDDQLQNLQEKIQWINLSTQRDVAYRVRDEIMSAAQEAIKKSGQFHIVFAGGSTPGQVYALLANEACDWRHWQIYLGDERCLPDSDSERNSQMVKKSLLDHISIPEENIHFIPAEQGAEAAAMLYAEEIEHILAFDLVMLGMGEDGHTASLFPDHVHDLEERVHAVYDAPKAPSDRVSLSAAVLSNNRQLIIMATGESKRTAIKQWQAGERLPVSSISSLGSINIFVDSAALENQ